MARYIEPLGNRVLVEPVALPTMTKGGLHIPEMSRERTGEGRVVAVGPGKMDWQGRMIAPNVAPGDKVMFVWIHGRDVDVGGKPHKILDYDQLEGKIIEK